MAYSLGTQLRHHPGWTEGTRARRAGFRGGSKRAAFRSVMESEADRRWPGFPSCRHSQMGRGGITWAAQRGCSVGSLHMPRVLR